MFKTFIQNSKFKIRNFRKGFTLIELLITIGIIGILGTGVFSAWVIGLQVTTEKRAEVTATAIAVENIERLKTLPYATLGTIGGIPAGGVPRETTIVRNGITYTVQTAIFYIDDPFDGVAPQDPIPTDYKRIRISVIWNGKFGVSPVVLMTDIAPKSIETTAGGGTLILRVVNAELLPVPDATVTIKNTKVAPPIDSVFTTNAEGKLTLPGAPASQEGYDVTVTKTGYARDATIHATIGINPSPTKPPLSVKEGQTIESVFSIDRLATLRVATVDNRGSQGWWRSAWPYRKNITIANNGTTEAAAGTPVAIDLDHAELLQEGKSLANGDDVRVVFFNGTYFEDLDRIATNAWNGSATRLWFATKRAIAKNNDDEGYALYYGNRNADAPLASPARIVPPAIGQDTLGLWYFDDGKGSLIARDASGNGNDGALRNMNAETAWVSGKFGSALAFSGANPEHVFIAPSASLGNTDAITIEAWIKPRRFWAKETIASKTLNGLQAGTFNFYLYDNSVCLMIWKDADIWNNTGCGGALTLNAWSHVAATFDGRYIRIYINGSSVATYEKPGNLIKRSDVEMAIGKAAHDNWDYFNGVIDTVAYHKSARTDFAYGKSTALTTELGAEKDYTQPNAVTGVAVTIVGTKTVGTDDAGKPIPKFTATKTTNPIGVITIPTLEEDAYTMTIDGATSGYDIAATAPPIPIVVPPASAMQERLTLVSHRSDTLLVTVKNKQTPLDGASVRLTSAGYDKTIVTGETGQSFFSPLSADTSYDLSITKPGYTPTTTTVGVHGQTYEDIAIAPL